MGGIYHGALEPHEVSGAANCHGVDGWVESTRALGSVDELDALAAQQQQREVTGKGWPDGSSVQLREAQKTP